MADNRVIFVASKNDIPSSHSRVRNVLRENSPTLTRLKIMGFTCYAIKGNRDGTTWRHVYLSMEADMSLDSFGLCLDKEV